MYRAFWCVVGCWLGVAALRAQSAEAVVSGCVDEAGTGLPLSGAHVFVAGSLRGAATGPDGCFRLTVPTGAHRLVVSMVGYTTVHEDLVVRTGSPRTFRFHLAPATQTLGDVLVEAERDRAWERQRRRFERLLLGETPNAAQTRLLNPEVLVFEGGRWGRLSARAQAPLLIENRALGYRIQYVLTDFSWGGGVLRFDGEPLFEELTPQDSAEAVRWEANRRQAFLGSLRHFLLCALADSSEAARFQTTRLPSLDEVARARLRFPVQPRQLLSESGHPDEQVLEFHGLLEVQYRREQESPAYLRWQGRLDRPQPQTSWLRLSDGPTRIDPHGELIDPYGLTVYGYLAFERLADEVPKEYRPSGLR